MSLSEPDWTLLRSKEQGDVKEALQHPGGASFSSSCSSHDQWREVTLGVLGYKGKSPMTGELLCIPILGADHLHQIVAGGFK